MTVHDLKEGYDIVAECGSCGSQTWTIILDSIKNPRKVTTIMCSNPECLARLEADDLDDEVKR